MPDDARSVVQRRGESVVDLDDMHGEIRSEEVKN
jgi:hypothetical protein